ncbi:hypothetical protein GE21DRAFT_1071845 [Neurospora crassa]|nr:hypothetical protein GE21DRAFT_1071845 [Neurospora crassa]
MSHCCARSEEIWTKSDGLHGPTRDSSALTPDQRSWSRLSGALMRHLQGGRGKEKSFLLTVAECTKERKNGNWVAKAMVGTPGKKSFRV